MSQIFREVRVEEADQFLRLTLDAYASIRELDIHFSAATATKEEVVKHLTENTAYVLEENGTFLSTISLRFPWGLNPGPLELPHIGWFATNPDYKRQGIGKKTLALLEEEVLKQQLKLPAVTLGTADNHPWLKEMYEKNGFVEIGQKDLGKGHITIYLRKILRPDLYQAWVEKHDETITK
ncbi:GNAT family N-acetyltransferase [Peribacillus loiseleuriae]|uniref:GNAT family N-acetyltransferase n=1 Tax=Peribacillus loiseleuriae TaxID=1679170 RepID=UPI0038190E38